MARDETRTCPFCKEEIKADAIKCKHCKSKLAPVQPDHEGVCPFCKEDVNPEAIKCKHCGSQIGYTSDTTTQQCSCSGSRQNFTPSSYELALRRVIDTTDYGQDCFWYCMAAGIFTHAECEAWCQISMPRQKIGWVFGR